MLQCKPGTLSLAFRNLSSEGDSSRRDSVLIDVAHTAAAIDGRLLVLYYAAL